MRPLFSCLYFFSPWKSREWCHHWRGRISPAPAPRAASPQAVHSDVSWRHWRWGGDLPCKSLFPATFFTHTQLDNSALPCFPGSLHLSFILGESAPGIGLSFLLNVSSEWSRRGISVEHIHHFYRRKISCFNSCNIIPRLVILVQPQWLPPLSLIKTHFTTALTGVALFGFGDGYNPSGIRCLSRLLILFNSKGI